MAAGGWVAAWATGVATIVAARPPEASAMVRTMSLPRWSRRFINMCLSLLFCWAARLARPLSGSGYCAQPGGCAQGMAESVPLPFAGLGCPGLGMQPPGQALAFGPGQLSPLLLLPLPGEFRTDVRVRDHGILLSVQALGCLACHQNDAPCGAALSSVNPAILRRLPGPGRTPMVQACWWAARTNSSTSTGC